MAIEQFKYSLQHTHFIKSDKFLTKYMGSKPFKDEEPHSKFIGKSKSTCRTLFGIGQIARAIGMDFGFGRFDNHVWLPQTDEGDTPNKGNRIYVCFNCGSVLANDNFVGNVEKADETFEGTFKEVKKE